jgi:hypothetical protein
VFGKSAGLAGSDLVKFSTDFTVLASDLASFNNTTPDEAITAIGSALRGEAEPLRRFGVLLDDASLRAAALELGIVSTTKNALTPQQKVLAAQELIFRQTGDAQGDFARTSDGLANSQRILTAQIENVKTSIGTALLPVATELFQFIGSKLIPILTNFSDSFSKQATPAIDNLRKVVVDFVLPALQNLWGFITEFIIPTLRNIFTPIINILQAAFVFLSQKVRENQESFTIAFNIMSKIFGFIRDHLAPILGGALATGFNIVVRAIGLAIDNFGRVFKIINEVAKFLGFDFSLEVDKATKTVNNLDSGIVDAYKSFAEQSRVVKQEVIPGLTSLNTATNALTQSKDKATESTKKLTTAKEALNKKTKEATVENDKLNNSLKESNRIAEDVPTSGTDGQTGSSVGAGGMDPLIGQLIGLKARGGTIQDLVNQFTGTRLGMTISTSNLIRNASDQLLTDMYEVILAQVSYQELIDKGLGNLNLNTLDTLLTLDDPGFRVLPGTRIGQSSLTVDQLVALAKPVTINVNGTFMDPEGAARAVQEVIQDSNARSGFQSLVPALGIE